MTNDEIRKLLETQEALRRQTEPLSAALKAMGGNAGLQRLIKEAGRNQELMRAALGPLEELRRAGVLNPASQLADEFRQMQDMLAETEKRFRLPAIDEANRLFREFEASGAAGALKRYHEQTSEVRRAMEAMRTPWLDMEDTQCGHEAVTQRKAY